MVRIEKNINLKSLNSFHIDAKAKYLCRITQPDQLQELLATDIYLSEKHYVLGGGTNILVTKDFDGLLIKVEMKGLEKKETSDNTVKIKVSAGENWHQLVEYAVSQQWGGIENLSLIPGTVGAAPMQNIGAYGVEIKDVVDQVEAIDLSSGSTRVFTNHECGFGYRESVFKNNLKEKFFISSVTLTLTTNNHRLNTSYGALQEVLRKMDVSNITIQEISRAVIQIRKAKLPDPDIIGNAGSFYKNPTIDLQKYEFLTAIHGSIPSYPIDNQHVKLPAGWLIEQCGWKGKRINHVGVHPLQALVLVNYDNGSGDEILQLAKEIQQSVFEKFQIVLTPEVNIL